MKSLSFTIFSNTFSVFKCSSSVDDPVRHVTETIINMQHPIWFTQAILMWFIILLESSAIKFQFRDKLPDNAVYSKCYSIQFTKDSSGGAYQQNISLQLWFISWVWTTQSTFLKMRVCDITCFVPAAAFFFPFIVLNVQNVSCSLKNISRRSANNANNSISAITVLGYSRCSLQWTHEHVCISTTAHTPVSSVIELPTAASFSFTNGYMWLDIYISIDAYI